MVDLYSKIHNRDLNDFIAHHEDTRHGVGVVTETRARRADAILRAHVFQDHSYITMYHSDVDWYVVLDDTRGLLAAMTIEFGRKGGRKDRIGRTTTHMEAVAPLRHAMGIEVK